MISPTFSFSTSIGVSRPRTKISTGARSVLDHQATSRFRFPKQSSAVVERNFRMHSKNASVYHYTRGAPVSASSTLGQIDYGQVGPLLQVPRICILGGGFGGLYTALRLSSLPWPPGQAPKIILVDKNDQFVFKPLLYEFLTGEMAADEVAPSYSSLLKGTSVKFLQGRVASIEPSPVEEGTIGVGGKWSSGGGKVILDESNVEYDWLVLALGAEIKLDQVPGVKELALPFATLEDAKRVDLRLSELERLGRRAEVAVVGGGVSGVELAATVAERMGAHANITVLTSGRDVMSRNPAGQRADAVKALEGYGVEVLPQCLVTSCLEVPCEGAPSKYKIDLQDGREVTADLVLWTAGQNPVVPEESKPVGAYGMRLARGGEVVTDPFLRVRRHPQVFALGDAAFALSSQGDQLPATAQVAFQAADYVGWNIWASVNDRPLLPFRYQHLGDMMALGTWDAAVALPMDLLNLNGRAASILRRAAYVYRQPTVDQALKVGFGFLRNPVANILGVSGIQLEQFLGSKDNL